MWTEYSSSWFWSPASRMHATPLHSSFGLDRPLCRERDDSSYRLLMSHELWVSFFCLFFQKKIYLCELETKDWKKSTSEAKESPNENNWVFQASTSQNGTVNSKWLDLAQNRLFLVIWSLPICSCLITTKLGQKHSLMVISTTPCELFISYKMLCRFYHLKNM